MIDATSRTKRPDTVKRGEDDAECVAVRVAKEEGAKTVKLSNMEEAMNENTHLRPSAALLEQYRGIDTRVTTCIHCAKRLLKFGEAIHYNEYHSCAIINEFDDGVAAQLKHEGTM